MLTIGLTGGIACGKSSVCRQFQTHQIEIIDADAIARELVMPNSPALAEIRDYFGETILTSNGELNRAKLKTIIFNQPDKKKWLEDCLHPKIRAKMAVRSKQAKSPYVILDIPLLFESEHDYQLDRILVVDCDESQQIKRARQRDTLSREQVEAIIASQVPRKMRLEKADDIINNEGSLTDLNAQVDALHAQYLALTQN